MDLELVRRVTVRLLAGTVDVVHAFMVDALVGCPVAHAVMVHAFVIHPLVAARSPLGAFMAPASARCVVVARHPVSSLPGTLLAASRRSGRRGRSDHADHARINRTGDGVGDRQAATHQNGGGCCQPTGRVET